MKKIIIFGIITTVMFLLFTSCEKDEIIVNNNIIIMDTSIVLSGVDTFNIIYTGWKYVKSERNGVEVFLIKNDSVVHNKYLTYTSYANDNGFYSFNFADNRKLNISNNYNVIADSININNGYIYWFDSYYGDFSYKIEYISNNSLQLSYISYYNNYIKMYFERKPITDNY
jgi:hypothetical protein